MDCIQQLINNQIKKIPKLLLFLFGIFLFFDSCATTTLPSRQSAKIAEDFLGLVHAGDTKTAQEYALLDELNATWMLSTFYWHRIQPERDRWDFNRYDTFVDSGKQAGKKILACLAYDAKWLNKNDESQKYISPENIPLFLDFVETIVRRYSGKVDAWEIWNEPNWTFWKGSNKEFYELTRLTAQRIRETDPNAIILGGAFWRVPKSFIKGIFKSGAMENISAVAFHPYATTPNATVKLYDKFIKILSQCNYTGDIWITEVGYPTAGWYPTTIHDDEMPSAMVKTLTGLAARGARTILWYELFDSYNQGEAPSKFNSEDFFGIVYPDYSLKKGAPAFALCGRYLADTEYQPEFPVRNDLPDSVVSFYFRGKDKNNTLILWNDKKTAQSLHIILSGDGLLHDIVTGSGQEFTKDTIIQLEQLPLIITWRDETDYAPPQISLK